MMKCWNRINRTAKWLLGMRIGCFSSGGNEENCNLPCTLNKPSSSRYGVSRAKGEDLATRWPRCKALTSAANSCCWTCWMRTCRACCISSYDTSPSLRSSCLCLELKMKRKTHATTRIAFVSLPHLSTWNTFSPGVAAMRTGPAVSSAITEHKTADGSNKSTSSLHLSTRNLGPCNQTFEKIYSSAVTPWVSRSAGFSTPEQWNHLSGEVKVCISTTRLATNAFHRLGSALIHERATIESDQQ